MREPNGILIFCLDNLGDLVFTSALVSPLRGRFPRARVALWSKAYAAPVAALIPGLDRTYAADPFWDRSPLRGKGKLLPFLRATWAVRRDRYDVALITNAHWRAPLTMVAAGIPVRIGRERRHNKRWLTHRIPADHQILPSVVELGQLLQPLGITELPTRYALDPTPLAARRERLTGRLGTGPLAAVHPFASDARRRAPLDPWIRVIEALRAMGLTVVALGSTRELAELRAAAGERPGWIFADQITDDSIADLSAIISLSNVYVGHDSGPLHIAAALGIPVIGAYIDLPNVARTVPQGPAAAAVIPVGEAAAFPVDEIVNATRRIWTHRSP